MLDLLIRGAEVIDGTGAPRSRADVGVTAGRVVSIGTGDEAARSTVDADGLFLTPGFIDLHTHYDAQLAWDPAASPSVQHGMTTVLGGNCGFTLAPAGPEHADYLSRMMAKVEGIPLEALQQGLTWDWSTYSEWLDTLDGHLGVNAGFLVGHSALRRVVMGEGCHEAATEEQVAQMVRLLCVALDSGGIGFSSSQSPTHHDGAGDPVPSRGARVEELVALATEAGRHAGTTLEMIVAGCLAGFGDADTALLSAMSAAADRPLNWNLLGVSAPAKSFAESQLSAFDGRPGRVVALTLPQGIRIRLSFLTGFILDGLPGWAELFSLPIPQRIVALRDPETRARLAEGATSPEAGMLRGLARWERLSIVETFSPESAPGLGRTVGEVAAERGADPFDALLDVVCADGLRTGLMPYIAPDGDADWELRAEVWRDPRVVLGGSDAGAHLDMMCGANYPATLLAEAVRARSLLSWEEAVRLMTDAPARLYGLTGRGRIAVGAPADLVLVDPATVAPGPVVTRDDLPGHASRLTTDPVGIDTVYVAGTAVVRNGSTTGATPGVLLRSGRDTETVRV